MNSIRVAGRLREQLERFSGIFSPRFTKPQRRFFTQMIYGIEASQDVMLSAIGRALGEEITLKKTEERLSHHLGKPGMAEAIHEQILEHAAPRIGRDTLIVLDPTDIRKSHAKRMPYLATVRDGSTGELGPGYWACVAVACEPQSRRMIPLHQRLWSAEAPGFESENVQLLQIVDLIRGSTQGRGIYVMDRGGDRMKLLGPLLERGLRFVIRLVGDRHLEFRGRPRPAQEIAADCPLNFIDPIVRQEHGRETRLQLRYGFRPVKLPGHAEPLFLVVIRGFGEEPLMLLTNVVVQPTRKSVWFLVQAYLARWRVEETIRFIKQSYRLEGLRVLTYERLKNLVALVLAAAYFSAVWLGESVKLAILTASVTRVARRFFGVPDFHYYALASGIASLLSRLARWHPAPPRPSPPHPSLQLSLALPP